MCATPSATRRLRTGNTPGYAGSWRSSAILGLEIAPYTLAKSVGEISTERRKELRRMTQDHGLAVVGLHWLLAKTEGLQLTSAEEAVRKRTADYLGELAQFCRDLGGELMVFGSPGQRRIPPGATRQQALDYAADTFARALPQIRDAGVKLCLEPLSAAETDFINSCAEATELLDRLAQPNFLLHLDVKALSAEDMPITDLICRYASRAGHFHANDPNRRGPGFGAVDFVPIFQS